MSWEHISVYLIVLLANLITVASSLVSLGLSSFTKKVVSVQLLNKLNEITF